MITYKVADDKGRTATYGESELLQLLFKASLDAKKVEERKGSTEITTMLCETLMATRTLLNNSLVDLFLIAFNTGFYYARFLHLNQVEIIESKEDSNAG
jgi:hypothetical protein